MEYLWIKALALIAVLIFFLTRKKKKHVKDIDVNFEPVGQYDSLDEAIKDVDNWSSEEGYLLCRSINMDLSQQYNKTPFTVAMYNGNRKKNQVTICLEHLKANGAIGINSDMASEYYDIKNVSSAITKLRKKGHEIVTVHEDYTDDNKPIGKSRYVLLPD